MARLGLCLVFLALCALVPQYAVPQTQSTSDGRITSASNQRRPRHEQPKCDYNGTYTNSRGQTVPRPENCSSAPQGATAQCRDGTYSFSRSRRGTCSHHGGVARWLETH